MGNIVISENTSIDGVIQDPTGHDGFRVGDWFTHLSGRDREAWAKIEFEEATGAEALLLGRRTYEWLVARGWVTRQDDWAKRLRTLPKYVVSSTLTDPEWVNATILRGDVVEEVTALKRNITGDIVVNGSGRLVHTLLENGLVDELRLIVFPFVIGDGDRVFGRTSDWKPMRLVDMRPVGDTLAHLTYRSA
jgi:dihydrofolate reductase